MPKKHLTEKLGRYVELLIVIQMQLNLS